MPGRRYGRVGCASATHLQLIGVVVSQRGLQPLYAVHCREVSAAAANLAIALRQHMRSASGCVIDPTSQHEQRGRNCTASRLIGPAVIRLAPDGSAAEDAWCQLTGSH